MIDDIPNINLNLKALETSIKMTEKSYFKLAEKEYESMCESMTRWRCYSTPIPERVGHTQFRNGMHVTYDSKD